jgi:hypothetical protein
MGLSESRSKKRAGVGRVTGIEKTSTQIIGCQSYSPITPLLFLFLFYFRPP